MNVGVPSGTGYTAPAVTTVQATNVIDVSATLEGTVVSGTSEVTTGFEYSTDPTMTTGVIQIQVGTEPAGTNTVSFSHNLTGLSPNTTYYYMAGALEQDNNLPIAGAILSFTTGPSVAYAWSPPGTDFVTGSQLEFTVNYDVTSPVVVNTTNGTPYIDLRIGTNTVRASYTGNNNSGDPNGLTFAYTVQAGDYSATGIVLGGTIHLNGGTIQSQGGANAGIVLHNISQDDASPNIALVNVTQPVVKTLAATNVSDVLATLNGTVISGNSAATTGFEYSIDPTMTTGVTQAQVGTEAAGTNTVPFSYNLTGLSPNTTYYYMAGALDQANNQATAGAILHFTTGPSVTGVWAPPGGDFLTGNDLVFTVNYDGTSPIVVDTRHGRPYINLTIGTGTVKAYYSGPKSGLPESITFTYTVQAGDYSATGVVLGTTINGNGGTIENQQGDGAGTALNNITPSNVAPNVALVNVLQPVVTTQPATSVLNTQATLNGTVISGSTNSTVSFAYGTVPGLTSGVTTVTVPTTVPAGTAAVPFSYNLTGLTPSTTYYFMAQALNSDPPLQSGAILSFKTPAALPVYPGGSAQALTVCENAPATSIDALLSTTYPVTGTTLTYTITSAPAHGALSANFPATATSAAGAFGPTGTTYMPAGGYSGTDQFSIQVSDGTNSATTTITVTVNPLPAVQPISVPSSVCPGASITLSDATTGGTWSVSDGNIASINPSSGALTGIMAGTTGVLYTVTSGTCSAGVTGSVTVNAPPAQPGAFTASQSTVTYGQTGVVYTVPNDPTVTQYIWSYSGTGVTINGTGNSVTLDFGPSATSGTLSVVAQGSCATNSTAQQVAISVVAPTITFTPATLNPATVGSAYSQVISGSGGTAPYGNFAVTAGSLPAGLTLSATGTLSGVPTAGGSFTFTISANDASTGAGPFTGTQVYTLQVNAPVITIAPSSLTATVGAAYSQILSASGGTAPYSNYTVTSGTLPAGLTLGTDGTLSGTPTAGGSFTFTVSATDASTGTGPYTGSQSITILVNAPVITLTPATLTPATVGVAYSQVISASGGTAPYGNFTVTGGTLPAGLTLGTDGTLSGTPTAGGSFTFTVSATDASTGTGPYTGSQFITILVNAPSITIAPSSLTATIGVAYSQVLSATGGTAPYSNYTVTGGTLPAGLTLGTDGTLSGTPTAGGSFTFTVSATDASTGTGPYTGTQSVTILVNPPVIALVPPLLPSGTVGVAYSQVISASGGTAPYTNYTVTGALPAGLTLGSDGTLSGIPTAGGNFSFTISVTDGSTGTGPYTVSQAYSLTVNAPTITLSPTTLPDGQYGQTYSAVTFGASGGTAPYGNFSVTNGSLPTGMTLSSAGVLSGTPGATGAFTFTVTASDASSGTGPYTGSATYTLHVTQAVLTITANNQSKTYGQANPALTVSYSGFINGDNSSSLTVQPTVTVSSTPTSGVGTYQIIVSGASDANYTIVYVNGTLTVNPATLLVTANDQSRYFGTPNPTLTYYFSGFVNGEDSTVLTSQPSISTTALQTSAPGQYPISLSGGSAANYVFTYQDGVLTINPSLVNTITFGSLLTKTYGDPDFAILATANSGLPVRFVSADNSIATVTADASGNWTVHIVAAGQVTIEAFQDGNADYGAATEVDQVLVINKADQTIAFVAPPSTAETGNAPITLSAAASSGLPITFTVSDPTLATISGDMITFTGTGTVTITATQPGNDDYNAAAPVSYTITVYNGGAFHSGIGVFPNPAHGTLYIHFDQNYIITKYILFGMNGQIVKGQENVTNNANVIPVDVSDLAPGYYLLRVVCITNNAVEYPVFKVLIQ